MPSTIPLQDRSRARTYVRRCSSSAHACGGAACAKKTSPIIIIAYDQESIKRSIPIATTHITTLLQRMIACRLTVYKIIIVQLVVVIVCAVAIIIV